MRILGGLVLVGVLVAGCGAAGSKAAPVAVKTVTASPSVTATPTPTPTKPAAVKFTVVAVIRAGYDLAGSGSHCHGVGVDADMRHGVEVTVYDAAGRNAIGVGYASKVTMDRGQCLITAHIGGLPVQAFYRVGWGSHKSIAFSRRDLVGLKVGTFFG